MKMFNKKIIIWVCMFLLVTTVMAGSVIGTLIDSSLITYYRLEETSYSNVFDYSLNQSNGTLQGTNITQGTIGKIGKAFTGTGGGMNGGGGIDGLGSIERQNLWGTTAGFIYTPVTINMWVKLSPNVVSGRHYALWGSSRNTGCGLDGSYDGWSLSLKYSTASPTNTTVLMVTNDNAAEYEYTNPYNTTDIKNTWTMITMTWNGTATGSNVSDSSLRFYINGDEVLRNTTSSSTLSVTRHNCITRGLMSDYGEWANEKYFYGDFDEVGIWNIALNSTLVEELYNSGAGLNLYPTPPSATNINYITTTNSNATPLPLNSVIDYINATCSDGEELNVSSCNITITDPSSAYILNSTAMTNISSLYTYGTDFTLTKYGNYTIIITVIATNGSLYTGASTIVSGYPTLTSNLSSYSTVTSAFTVNLSIIDNGESEQCTVLVNNVNASCTTDTDITIAENQTTITCTPLTPVYGTFTFTPSCNSSSYAFNGTASSIKVSTGDMGFVLNNKMYSYYTFDNATNIGDDLKNNLELIDRGVLSTSGLFGNGFTNSTGYLFSSTNGWFRQANGTESFTIAFWWKSPASVITDCGGGNNCFFWDTRSTNTLERYATSLMVNSMAYDNALFLDRRRIDTGATNNVRTGNIVGTGNTWYFIVYVYNSSLNDSTNGNIIYLANVSRASSLSEDYEPLSGDIAVSNTINGVTLGIGRKNMSSTQMKGVMDEFMVFDDALSVQQINYIYNNGTGKTYPFGLPSVSTNLSSYSRVAYGPINIGFTLYDNNATATSCTVLSSSTNVSCTTDNDVTLGENSTTITCTLSPNIIQNITLTPSCNSSSYAYNGTGSTIQFFSMPTIVTNLTSFSVINSSTFSVLVNITDNNATQTSCTLISSSVNVTCSTNNSITQATNSTTLNCSIADDYYSSVNLTASCNATGYSYNASVQSIFANTLSLCTGGTISFVGTDIVHTFLSNDTINCTGNVTPAQVLVVAGGAGGAGNGGGGGAGGLIYNTSYLLELGNYNVIIGMGGAGSTNENLASSDGQNSVLGNSTSNLTAIGGGGAGSRAGQVNGRTGGSGGGSGWSGTAGSGTTGQGYAGGATHVWGLNQGFGVEYCYPGGGGSGQIGMNGSQYGQGGNGTYININGTYAWYAGGGGGGGDVGYRPSYTGIGGQGGGGRGGFGANNGTDGTANTGGGGGSGGMNEFTMYNGHKGGSGIVIIRYSTLSATPNVTTNLSSYSTINTTTFNVWLNLTDNNATITTCNVVSNQTGVSCTVNNSIGLADNQTTISCTVAAETYANFTLTPACNTSGYDYNGTSQNLFFNTEYLSPQVYGINWRTTGGVTDTILIYNQIMSYINATCSDTNLIGCNLTVTNPNSVVTINNLPMSNISTLFNYSTQFTLNVPGNWIFTVKGYDIVGHVTTNSSTVSVSTLSSSLIDGYFGWRSTTLIDNATLANLSYYRFDLIEARVPASNLSSNWSYIKTMISNANALNMKMGLAIELDYDLNDEGGNRTALLNFISTNFTELTLTPYQETLEYVLFIVNETYNGTYTDGNLTTGNLNIIAMNISGAIGNPWAYYSNYNSSTLDANFINYNTMPYVAPTSTANMMNQLAALTRNTTLLTRMYVGLDGEQKQVAKNYFFNTLISLTDGINTSTRIPYSSVSELDNGDLIVYNNQSTTQNVTYVLTNGTDIVGKDIWDYYNHILLSNNSAGTIAFLNIPAYSAIVVGTENINHISMDNLISASAYKIATDTVTNMNYTDGTRDGASDATTARSIELWDSSYEQPTSTIYYGWLNSTGLKSPYAFDGYTYVIIADKNNDEIDKLFWTNVSIDYVLGYITTADFNSTNATWLVDKEAEVDAWLTLNPDMDIFADGLDIGYLGGASFETNMTALANYIKLTKGAELGINVFTQYQSFAPLASLFAMKESCGMQWVYANGVNSSDGYNYTNQDWSSTTGDYNKSIWYFDHNIDVICVPFVERNDTAFQPSSINYSLMEKLYYKVKVLGYEDITFETPNFNILYYDRFPSLGTKLQTQPSITGDVYSMTYSKGTVYYNATSDVSWFSKSTTYNNGSLKLLLFDDVVHTYNICINEYCGFSAVTPGDGWSYDYYTIYFNETVFNQSKGHYMVNVTNADGGYIGTDSNVVAYGKHSFYNAGGYWASEADATGNNMIYLLLNTTIKENLDATDKIIQSQATTNQITNISLTSSYEFNKSVWTSVVNLTPNSLKYIKIWNGSSFVTATNYTNSVACLSSVPVFSYNNIAGLGYVGICIENTTTMNIRFDTPHLSDFDGEVSVDTIAPNITTLNKVNNSWSATKTVTFGATVIEDNPANITLYINGTANQTRTYTNNTAMTFTAINLSDGWYYWNVLANDSSENSAWFSNYTFGVDTIPPTINITNPRNDTTTTYDPTTPKIYTINYTVTDLNAANCSLYVNATINYTATSISANNNITLSVYVGSYEYYISCLDLANNYNTSSAYYLHVADGTAGGTPTPAVVGGGPSPAAAPYILKYDSPQPCSVYTNYDNLKLYQNANTKNITLYNNYNTTIQPEILLDSNYFDVKISNPTIKPGESADITVLKVYSGDATVQKEMNITIDGNCNPITIPITYYNEKMSVAASVVGDVVNALQTPVQFAGVELNYAIIAILVSIISFIIVMLVIFK